MLPTGYFYDLMCVLDADYRYYCDDFDGDDGYAGDNLVTCEHPDDVAYAFCPNASEDKAMLDNCTSMFW